MNIDELKTGRKFKVSIKLDTISHFCRTTQNKEMFNDLGEVWEIYWDRGKGDFRTTRYQSNKIGWYITEHELKTNFKLFPTEKEYELAELDQSRMILEKTVVINDMRVTAANMEEFFEKIRKMLK